MVDLSYYQQMSNDRHRLRELVKRDKPVIGISLPKDRVMHLLGTWYTTTVSGTTIILESGVAPPSL